MGRRITATLSLRDRNFTTNLRRANTGVNKFSRQMKYGTNEVRKWKNETTTSFKNVASSAAKLATAYLGVKTAIAGVSEGFKGLIDLQESSAKVKSIAKDSLDLEGIRKDLLKASNQTGILVSEIAETQYSAISAGVKAEESLQGSLVASKLAKAGFSDANSSLKLLTSTMNAYGLSGIQAMTDISDKMLVTQNLGVTTVAELSESLGNLTPIASSAGISIDEMLSGIAALTKGGMDTATATTNLKGAISSIISPSAEAQKMAKKLGINFSASALKAKGFPKFLEEIKEKTSGNTEQMATLFGNVRGLSAMLALTGQGNKYFTETLEAMANSSGETDDAFKVMTNTIGYKLKKLKNIGKNTLTSIANTSSGKIGTMIENFSSWVENNETTIQEWTNKIGTGIGDIITAFQNLATYIRENVAPRFASIIVLVSGIVDTYFPNLRGSSETLTEKLGGLVIGGLDLVIGGLTWIKDHSKFVENAVIGLTSVWLANKLALLGLAAVEKGYMIVSGINQAITFVRTAANIGYAASILSGNVVVGIATALQWAWNAALTANPIGVIIMLVAGFIFVIYKLIKNLDKVIGVLKKAWGWLTKWNKTKIKDKNAKVTVDEETTTTTKNISASGTQNFSSLGITNAKNLSGVSSNMQNFGLDTMQMKNLEYNLSQLKGNENAVDYMNGLDIKSLQKLEGDTINVDNSSAKQESKQINNNFKIDIIGSDLTVDEVTNELVNKLDLKLQNGY